MIRLLVTVSLMLVGAGAVAAGVLDAPDQVMLENTFTSIRVIDSFALATTESGLACLKYDSAFGRFDAVSRLQLPSEAYTIRLDDGVAAVATWADVVYFIDIAHLPALTLLGEADLGYAFYDYSLRDQNLYVARGYEGLWRYALTGYSDPVLADSSMRGIHCVQLEVHSDELLALDDYNGLLRYDISDGTLTHYSGCLYLPRRAGSFCLADTTAYVALAGRSQIYAASLADIPGRLVDSVTLLGVADAIDIIDTFVVAMNLPAVTFELIKTATHTSTQLTIPGDYASYYDGDAHLYGGRNYLYLPVDTGGIYSLDFNQWPYLTSPEQAYAHPGPVTGLWYHAGRLVTAGIANPVEFWQTPVGAQPTLDTAAVGITRVQALTGTDWACFAFRQATYQIIPMALTDDTLRILESIDLGGYGVNTIKYVDHAPIDTLDALLLLRSAQVEVVAVPPSHEFVSAAVVSPSIDVLDAVIVDSFLIVSTGKAQVYAYKLNRSYGATLWWAIGSPRPLRHLIPTTSVDTSASGLSAVVCGFSAGAMYRITVPRLTVGTVSYVRSLPMEVRQSVDVGGRLYTIGDGGVGVFDLSSGFPDFLEYGGFGGRMIASDGQTLATSSGSVVYLYDLGVVPDLPEADTPQGNPASVLSNYPNPFNPTTSIRYDLAQDGAVSLTVVNLLGQTVCTLVDRYESAGIHEVVWSGTDDRGGRVASGVYFCRLVAEGLDTSRKMILLK